jgi:hypothetical protein
MESPDRFYRKKVAQPAIPALYACIMVLQPVFRAETIYSKVTDHFRWFASYGREGEQDDGRVNDIQIS